MADANQRISIEITAQSAQFLQELARAASGAQAAAKKIETSFEGATKQAIGFGKSILGALGITASIGGLVALFESIREKTAEAERSVAQLNAVLLATGGAAGLTSKALDELGKSVRGSSIFDDDEIRKAEVALLRFRSVQKGVFEDAIRSAPNLAAALGVGLPEAAVILGRALEGTGGQMRQLKSVGLALSQQNIDLADRMQEAGDKAGAQRLRLDELNKSIGGAGAAETSGLFGATKRLARAFEDLEKAAGRKIFADTDLIEGTIGVLDKWATAIDKAKISYSSLWETVKSRGAFGAATDALRALTSGGETGGRLAKGKIGGLPDPAETEAFMKSVEGRLKESSDKQYNDQQAAIKKLAEGSASYYGSELAKTKLFLDTQQMILQFGYSRGTITTEAYFAGERQAAEDTTAAERRFIGQRIEALAALAHAQSTTLAERTGLELQIHDLADKFEQTREQRAKALLVIDQQQILAVEKLGDAYSDLAAKVAEAQGNTAGAAALNFEVQQRDFRQKLETIAGAGGIKGSAAEARLADLDTLAKLGVAQAALNDITRKYSQVLGEVDVALARIDLRQQTGQLTEIGAINAKAAEAQKRLLDLRAELDRFAAKVATMPDGPIKDAGILKVEQMRLEIDKLAAQSDVLAAKFRDALEGPFAEALLSAELRTKSLRDTFKDLAKSIETNLLQIANKNIAETIFGKGGVLGGLPEGLAKLFGGGGAAAAAPGTVALTTAGSTLTVAGTSLTAAAVSLQAAAVAMGASGAASGASSIVGGVPWTSGFDLFGAAEGGTVSRGGWLKVGERGQEIVKLPRGAQVIPMDSARRGARGGDTYHVYQTVMPGASRASAEQSAAETLRAMQRARRVS